MVLRKGKMCHLMCVCLGRDLTGRQAANLFQLTHAIILHNIHFAHLFADNSQFAKRVNYPYLICRGSRSG